MAKDWKQLRDLLNARIVAAHTLAQAIDPTIVLKIGQQNRESWTAEVDKSYLRAYYTIATNKPLAAGDWSVERTWGNAHLDILLRAEINDDIALEIARTTRDAFLTGDDGLEFESGSVVSSARRDGVHWLAPVIFPFTYDL